MGQKLFLNEHDVWVWRRDDGEEIHLLTEEAEFLREGLHLAHVTDEMHFTEDDI